MNSPLLRCGGRRRAFRQDDVGNGYGRKEAPQAASTKRSRPARFQPPTGPRIGGVHEAFPFFAVIRSFFKASDGYRSPGPQGVGGDAHNGER